MTIVLTYRAVNRFSKILLDEDHKSSAHIGQSHVVDKQHYGFHPTLTLHNVTSQGLNEKLSGLNKCVTHLTNDT